MTAPRPPRRGPDLLVCHLGLVPYERALAAQTSLRAARIAGEIPDTLLTLSHPPVYTRGRRAGGDDLPFAEDFYRARGHEVVDVDRGGRVTWHGPGQLVGYPIMAVGDVVRFVRDMEAAILAALGEEGIGARTRTAEGPDYTGVWVQDRKIASIGVHIHRGVSTHGFAVNVHNDLEPFNWVVACGLPGVQMTSVERERTRAQAPGDGPAAAGRAACERELRCMRLRTAARFAEARGRRQRLVSPRALGIEELLATAAREPEAVSA